MSKKVFSTQCNSCMKLINRTMPRKNTPAPFKSSCFTETSRIAAGTLLLTEFARWHPGAPASRASGGFTAPDFLSLHSACIQVALLYFCEHFANSPLGRSAPRWRPAEIDSGHRFPEPGVRNAAARLSFPNKLSKTTEQQPLPQKCRRTPEFSKQTDENYRTTTVTAEMPPHA